MRTIVTLIIYISVALHQNAAFIWNWSDKAQLFVIFPATCFFIHYLYHLLKSDDEQD